ncbi:MAG: hypothetical protein AAFY47_11850, partial [Pseudomonadota bacterium]
MIEEEMQRRHKTAWTERLIAALLVGGMVGNAGAAGALAQEQRADPLAPVDLLAETETTDPEAVVEPADAPETNGETNGETNDQSESFDEAFPEVVSNPIDQADLDPQASLAQPWTLAGVEALIAYIENIEAEGLDPADYDLQALKVSAQTGVSAELDQLASKNFTWLVEDIRDGRTPMAAREQWFVVDPDRDRYRTSELLAKAAATGDVAGVLDGLHPVHADYAALRAELAATPQEDLAKRKLIRANMDRWRWLARDLGTIHLITNVPEFQLRLRAGAKTFTYKTIVGKPGRTATPQLAEDVSGVVFNPTWTVPQSIVVGEGLGARVLNNPAWAKKNGYKATKGANG